MKFRMNCPKCGSTNFSIERDNRSYAPRGQTFEMIFSCRCGKQMFGEQIVKEYERQKKDWEATVSAEEREERHEPVQDERRAVADARAADEDLDEAVDLEEDDADFEEEERPAARSRAASSEDDDDEDGEDSDVCGWHPCSNPPRPNSKYCSRDCSNKNARWRYKQRKAAEKEAA